MLDKHVATRHLILAETNTCAELRLARQHSVRTVRSFSTDKYMYNRSSARHILSLFWLLYLSNEVPNAMTYTLAYDGLSLSYAYDRLCIWQTNFPGPTDLSLSYASLPYHTTLLLRQCSWFLEQYFHYKSMIVIIDYCFPLPYFSLIYAHVGVQLTL